jgi:hypothetical protein
MEEAMFALTQRKKEWEYQNQKILLRLVQTSSDVSVESVKTAGLVTSFLLYLIYKMIRGMLALGAFLLLGPQPVRKVAPGQRPLEYHEFNQQHLENQLRSAPRWR